MKARKFVTGIQNAMVLVLFLGAPLSTNGQVESGRFVGRITDVQGASVPRAIVKATNTGTNIVQSAITDSSGDFVITPVSATNQDLARLITEGRFREDLFYRINVIPISLPPLRDRREDIGLLADHFLAKYNEQMGKEIAGVSRESMELLVKHDWPGNIRELENVMERAVALEATPTILPESLPASIRGDAARATAPPVDGLPESGFDLEEHVKEIERGYIAEALKRAGGVQVKAAELLGMSFRSFRYYVKKYNLR